MRRLPVATVVAVLVASHAFAQTAPQAQQLADETFAAPTAPAPAPPQPVAPQVAPQAAPAPAAAAPADGGLSPRQLAGAQARVGGRYRTQGANLDGSPYEGEAEIIASGRDRCRIVWRTGKRSEQRGICMRSGFVFVAAYQFREGAVGIVTYEVQPDGVLKGMWTIADADGRGTEVLTPLR
ncbi:MAG: hypothetical protein IPL88_12905 [Rhizobiales bacterium]|nr:hypothetical protein [Hyphomicrobiales bacterium]